MKKIIIKGLIYIIIGYILGNILFKSKIDLIKNITNKEIYYFIEEKGSNVTKTSIKGYDNLYIKPILHNPFVHLSLSLKDILHSLNV